MCRHQPLRETLLDQARWAEVVVLAAVRDPLEGVVSVTIQEGSTAREAIELTEAHLRTVELLAPHVVAIDVRPRLGLDLPAVRRALAREGVRVPPSELLRSWGRWFRSSAGRTPLDRALHGRLVLGVRGHHLDDRLVALRQRLDRTS